MVLLKRVREAGIAPVFLMQWTFCLFLVFCFLPQDILYAQDDDEGEIFSDTNYNGQFDIGTIINDNNI